MKDLVPIVPRGWNVVGRLRDTACPELLNGAMVELSHPGSDILIYAGWEPEEDPTGHYVIGVIRGCEPIGEELITADMASAAQELFHMAEKFHPNAIVSLNVKFIESTSIPVICASGVAPTIPHSLSYSASETSRVLYSKIA